MLIDCLSRENDFAAQEVIEVLRTCICYVSSDQLPHVGPAVLQAMYQILQSDNVRSLMRLLPRHDAEEFNLSAVFVPDKKSGCGDLHNDIQLPRCSWLLRRGFHPPDLTACGTNVL